MGNVGTTHGRVKSVERLLRIIEGLEELDGAGITELSEYTDIPKSTIHRHVSTLVDNEYVVQRGMTYRLSHRFLELGGYVRQTEEISKIVRPKVEQLAEETGERANFLVEEAGLGVIVYTRTGENAVTTGVRVGKRIPLHCLSSGKSMLAHLPDERVDQIIETRGLDPVTPETITEREQLLDELDRVRDRGYAFDKGESIEGLHCVGVPVIGPNEDILGALSVAGPAHRMKGEWYESTIPDLILGMANEIELNIQYSE
ncbi:MAG: IclR family transcriptional regulator [Halobacteriota archaeon]